MEPTGLDQSSIFFDISKLSKSSLWKYNAYLCSII